MRVYTRNIRVYTRTSKGKKEELRMISNKIKSMSSNAESMQPLSRLGFAAIGIGSFLGSLDLFIVNLALPSIKESFPESGLSDISWVINAYSICFASALILSGKLADKYGRKKILQLAIGLFGLTSAACSLSPSLISLVISRGIQGIAGAMIIPSSLGLLLSSYSKEHHKRVIGIWAASGSIAAAIGPTLGGILVDIDWHLIFSLNIPLVVIGLLFSLRLKESKRQSGPLPSVFASLLLIISIGSIVVFITHITNWSNNFNLLLLTVLFSLFSILTFINHCKYSLNPLIDLALFKEKTFTTAIVGMGCFYMSFSIMLLGGTLFLTQAWKLEPTLAGLAFAIGPATAGFISLQISKIKKTAQDLAVIGAFFYVITGLWWFSTLQEASIVHYFAYFLPGLLLTGAGAGIAQTGFVGGGVVNLPSHAYSLGTGIINTSRQVGAAIGVAIFISVTQQTGNVDSFKSAWLFMSLLGFIACISAWYLRKVHSQLAIHSD